MKNNRDFTLTNISQGSAGIKCDGKLIGTVFLLSSLAADDRHYSRGGGWFGQLEGDPRRLSNDPYCNRIDAVKAVVAAYKGTKESVAANITDHRDCKHCSPARPYCVWTLAPDDGGDERGHIIVTDNGETEVTGVIVEHSDALMIASAFNRLHELGITFRDSGHDSQR